MKKLLFIVALICLSLNMNAQDDEAFANDTAKLVEALTQNAFKPIIAQFNSMIPEENKEVFNEELNATFPDLYMTMAKIYMEEFTHEEILALLEFYETPVGKKLADKSGELSQKGMTAGQSWGMKIQEIIEKHK